MPSTDKPHRDFAHDRPRADHATMVMPGSHSMRRSLQVAPLAISKGSRNAPVADYAAYPVEDSYQPTDGLLAPGVAHSTTSSDDSDATTVRAGPRSTTSTSTSTSNNNMTPPATPNGSQEDLVDLAVPASPPPVFHNFLRAFFHFKPSFAMSDSTVTLPLNEGDVVLVHSIHTNGWADGTLLVSGARGWLPTNYCEPYEPEEMRNLLKALLNFWDLLRSTEVNDREIFGNQEFMKGIIAGVRYLLERTNALTRESPIVQRHDGVRRSRKSLLSELSALVKSAKRLQEHQRLIEPTEDINDIIDEMILKAFKIVTKSTRFLDILDDDRKSRAPDVTVMATVLEESGVPLTPPAEPTSFEDKQADSDNLQDSLQASDAASRAAMPARPTPQPSTSTTNLRVQTSVTSPTNKRLSILSPTASSPRRLSVSSPKRLSSTITHRVSLAGPSPLSQPQNLVSQRLSDGHDTFLSYLGSFIGRLHLQSQSRPHLALAVKQSATSGGQLLVVVDVVCSHNDLSLEVLEECRTAMYDRLRDLVHAAQDILSHHGAEEDDIVVPQDNSRLLYAATGCVRATGECVAKTKWFLEKIGDFEFELEDGASALDMDLSFLEIAPAEERIKTPALLPSVSDASTINTDTSESRTSSSAHSVSSAATATNAKPEPSPAKEAPLPAIPTSPPRKTPTPTIKPTRVSVDKPLPQVPQLDADSDHERAQQSPTSSRPQSYVEDGLASMASSVASLRPVLPPLPKLATTLMAQEEYSPSEQSPGHDSDFRANYRAESMTASSTGTGSTYMSRDSEASLVSQSSTRATTPDFTMNNKPSLSDISNAGSGNAEEEDVECRLLEKTFAHELMFNKEGQVTGGSLPALVERLTTHEATPDAMFVSTFYLTFRLFCTPLRLAESLIERFDYVGETPHMAGPVRLRVYNVFKGWLESHWRDETDREALALIEPFASIKLSSILPSAGRRILELTQRVSSSDGTLVPRLVSSMGKTNTSISQYIPADTPLPNPILTKSQAHALANWKNGGSCPTVLDFDPLEIARQLTIRQMNIFCCIMPEELLGSQWMKKGGVDSPNVKAMSGLSTDLSNLVADTILQYNEVKKRAAVIKHWIKVAHQCLDLNNYDALMAIICSLNSSTITRLRRTWEVVSARRREILRQLQAIVEPAQNNKVLRGRLHDHVPPCLPFLGMFLTDLTFVDIGNPATKQLPCHGAGGNDGQEAGASPGLTVVNFDKHARTAKIIGELQRFQIPYRLHELPDMQEWLAAQVSRVRELETPSNNIQVSYYRKSLLLEPRETAAAAQQQQQLRPIAEAQGVPTSTSSAASNTVGGFLTPTPAATVVQKTDYFGWMRGAGNSNNNAA